MDARAFRVGSLKINFAIADIFHAKLGKLEVRKPISLLCDGDDLAVRMCDVDRLRHPSYRLLSGISTIRNCAVGTAFGWQSVVISS